MDISNLTREIRAGDLGQRALTRSRGQEVHSPLSALSTSTGEGEARGSVNGLGTDDGQRTMSRNCGWERTGSALAPVRVA